MNDPANDERFKKLLIGLQECGATNAIVICEVKDKHGVTPYIAKMGSPMACMALTEWAASYQHEQVYEGLEVTIWYDEDEDEV